MAQTYDPEWFAQTADSEDRHFWFVARNRVLETILTPIIQSRPINEVVLEVGCGTGNVLRVMENVCAGHSLIGMDLFAEGLKFARTRVSCPLVRGDMSRPPFNTLFGLIGLFDVLEHLPDDASVLRNLRAMLAPGASLILTVPAHPSLSSYFDEASHHCRRYEEHDLRSRLEAAGFAVDYLTPIFAVLLPLMRLQRGSQSTRTADSATDDLKVVPGLNTLLTWLLSAELPALRARRRLPFGTSLLAIARAV